MIHNANGPILIYTEYSTSLRIKFPVLMDDNGTASTAISIDHLPTLVARVASDELSDGFSGDFSRV